MWEPHANGTFTSGRLVHTGQFFIDDSLNEVIDKVRSFTFSAELPSDQRLRQIYPYNLNPIKDRWGRTRNWDDSLQIYQESHRNGGLPPFCERRIG